MHVQRILPLNLEDDEGKTRRKQMMRYEGKARKKRMMRYDEM